MRRNYSMGRVLYPLICMVWLVLFEKETPKKLLNKRAKKEPPALAAGDSGKATRLVQEPHHT